MARLELTEAEIVEVRLQVGIWVTPDMLTDAQIQAETILGAASDYVFEKVREDLNLDRLPDLERGIAERFADETDDDIASFVNVVLKPPQRRQMRRSVVYYSGGLCVPLVARVVREGAVGVDSERELLREAGQLFQLADSEIARLRNAFPDDAFERPIPTFRLFSVTGC